MVRYEVYVTVFDNSKVNGVSKRFNAVYSLSDKAREERTRIEEERGVKVVFEKRIEMSDFGSVKDIPLRVSTCVNRANDIGKFDKKGLQKLLESSD